MILRTNLDASGAQYEKTVPLFDVLLVPELHANLISCYRLCENGYHINIGRYKCNGMHGGTEIGRLHPVIWKGQNRVKRVHDSMVRPL